MIKPPCEKYYRKYSTNYNNVAILRQQKSRTLLNNLAKQKNLSQKSDMPTDQSDILVEISN